MVNKRLCGLLFFVFSLCFIQLANATKVDKIVMFGDSLSDNGNIYALTLRISKVIPLVPIIPKNPPYYEGRFSNGPIWVDDLAMAMGITLEDYAYGGAWAEPLIKSGVPIPSLGTQVSDYLMRSILDRHKDKHLYIIWTGGNDYLQGRHDVEQATSSAVAVIKNQMEWLLYYGAKNVVVINLPDLSITPEVVAKGEEVISEVAELTRLHNEKLTKAIAEVREKYTDAKVMEVNTVKYFNDIVKNPAKYKLKNITDPCYNGNYWLRGMKLKDDKEIKAAKEIGFDLLNNASLRTAYMTGKMAALAMPACKNPDEYLFWDHVHPTKVMHQYIAMETLTVLQNNDVEGGVA